MFVLLLPKQKKNIFYFATEVKLFGEWVGKILFNTIIAKYVLLLLLLYAIFIYLLACLLLICLY